MKIALWSLAGIVLIAAVYSAGPDLRRYLKMSCM
jgi:hypothetical protein